MKALTARVVTLVLVVSVLAAGSVSADARCNGLRGVQVWDGANFQGASITWCQNAGGAIDRTNLYFEGWNDRIGSFQTFNMPWNLPTCFSEHAYHGGIHWVYWGNVQRADLGAANNRWSSLVVKWPEWNPCV